MGDWNARKNRTIHEARCSFCHVLCQRTTQTRPEVIGTQGGDLARCTREERNGQGLEIVVEKSCRSNAVTLRFRREFIYDITSAPTLRLCVSAVKSATT